MKQHTAEFKQELINMGKQIDSIITYEENNETITLHEELYAVTPHYEANLLKSVMKQLDVECSINLPLNTIINYRLGVKVGNNYEYLNYGNYVVYKSEKKEDTNTYLLTCYDKILYAMKDNEDLEITYPISIKNYLSALCTKIGLTLGTSSFYNDSLEIQEELYLGLEYTYRDILDEIAQATGSIICINSNDELEVRYLNNTSDIINENFIKDVNVKFGEKYGPINSIVLSRSGESDNAYLSDEQSVTQNGLCEIKIIDNQILNWNDRDDYLPGILNALDGVEYYINDFNSIGILYYDVGDYYYIQIGENMYKCLMLNDEINIRQGIEEIIHTDMPEESETDYSKADKTDRKINKTYLIVDKQNQKIESIITQIGDRSSKTTSITQDVDGVTQTVQGITDTTITGSLSIGSFIGLSNINQSEPIEIKIIPKYNHNISFLYPRDNLYPSNSQFMPCRILRFKNTITNEIFDYELPDDLLSTGTYYDEFYLNYYDKVCKVTKRCGYNADGTVYKLSNEIVTNYDYPKINLTEGNYQIGILSNNTNYIEARFDITLMKKNNYTSQFATKAELSSSITQTENEINLKVDEKLDEEDFTSANIMLKINNDESSATINADKINLNGAVTANDYFKINTDGSMECSRAKIQIPGGDGTGAYMGLNIVAIDPNDTYHYGGVDPGFFVLRYSQDRYINAETNQFGANMLIRNNSDYYISSSTNSSSSNTMWHGAGGYNTQVSNTGITTPTVTQTSKEEDKKNFEKLQNGLDIIKNTDIYKYNLKTQKDGDKKHIGFVIGKDYKYSEEITSLNNDGVDIYSMIAVAYKAIQEQQKQIEELKKEIKNMKGE